MPSEKRTCDVAFVEDEQEWAKLSTDPCGTPDVTGRVQEDERCGQSPWTVHGRVIGPPRLNTVSIPGLPLLLAVPPCLLIIISKILESW